MWNSIERCLKDFQIIFHHKRDLGGGLELRGETDGYWRAESGQTVSLTLHGLSLLKLELSHQHHIAVHYITLHYITLHYITQRDTPENMHYTGQEGRHIYLVNCCNFAEKYWSKCAVCPSPCNQLKTNIPRGQDGSFSVLLNF